MKLSYEINPGWKHIILRVEGLEAGKWLYSDSEQVHRHPFCLRIRMKLALNRIIRRNRKLAKFMQNNQPQ